MEFSALNAGLKIKTMFRGDKSYRKCKELDGDKEELLREQKEKEREESEKKKRWDEEAVRYLKALKSGEEERKKK